MNEIDDDTIVRRLRADIDRLVGDAGDAAPPPAPTPEIQFARPAPRRWIPIAAAAATLAMLTGGLVLISNRGSDDATPAATPAPTGPDTVAPSTPRPSTPPSTVVAGSTTYETIAAVIEEGGRSRLCFTLIEPMPPQCGAGLLLVDWSWEGIDVEQVNPDGTRWVGEIYLRGTYDAVAQTFTVVEARPATDADRDRIVFSEPPLDTSVPCPEPSGGGQEGVSERPSGDQLAAIEGYAGAWYPEAPSGVLTVKFTGDLAAAEAAVREIYSGRLCVLAAAHSEAELLAIQEQLDQLSSIQILSSAVFVDASGEWVEAEVVAPDPARQAAFDAEFGTSVVRLSPLLRPTDAATTPPATGAPRSTIPQLQLVEAVATVLESPESGPQLCLAGILESFPPQCAGGPGLANFSWDLLDDEETANGTTWGTSYVKGQYDHLTGVLTVSEQRAPTDDDAARFAAAFPQADYSTPCEEPAGGWPASSEAWPGEQIAAIEGFAGAWSEAGQPMTVKFTGDLEAAEAEIRRHYSGPVCVVPATHSFAQLSEIAAELTSTGGYGTVDVIVDVTGEWVDVVSMAPQPWLQPELDARYGAGVVRLRSLMLPVT